VSRERTSRVPALAYRQGVLLPETARRVDGIVRSAQATGRVPGIAAGVVRDGALVHVSAAGAAPQPWPDTQYRIGSITKTLTAALILQLRDDERLSLDDPLDRYVPGAPATIREILAHVGGLEREPAGEWWERAEGRPLGQPSVVTTGYHYSNVGYGLLGAVAAAVTGQPWWDLVGKHLLEPLGMRRTTYHPEEPFARGYVVHPWHQTLREEPRHDAGPMAPAGQLWSTVDDLGRWAAFLAGPSHDVLAPATVTEMYRPVAISDPERWTAGHGLGLRLWRRGERVYAGHTGSMPGYLAVLVVHRASRTGVVAYANAYTLAGTSIGALGLDLLDAVLDGEPEPVTPWRPAPAPPPEIEPLTGRWWWMGREHEVRWDGELVMVPLGHPEDEWRFVPAGPDRWRCRTGTNSGETLTVVRSAAGDVVGLDVATAVLTR
jgi:CubicO group peptidase (beta-lactamase class C family)